MVERAVALRSFKDRSEHERRCSDLAAYLASNLVDLPPFGFDIEQFTWEQKSVKIVCDGTII